MHSISECCHTSYDEVRVLVLSNLPQSKLPISRSIGVPLGKRLHPSLQPRPLGNEIGERWRRHYEVPTTLDGGEEPLTESVISYG